MRTPSENWNEVYNSGSSVLLTELTINSVEYDISSPPVIDRQTMPSAFSVGHCCAASLQVSVKEKSGYSIANGDTIIIRIKLDNTNTWLDYGKFYVDACKKDHNGILNITAYDAIIKTEQDFMTSSLFNGNSLSYPTSARLIYNQIVGGLGVGIDTATFNILETTAIFDAPVEQSARELLSLLGSYYGGNFYITESGTLKLMRFVRPPIYDSESQTSNADVNADYVLGSLDYESNDITLTRVKGSSTDEEGNTTIYMSSGVDTGYILDIGDSPYFSQTSVNNIGSAYHCNNSLRRFKYVPFSATQVVLNPAVEIGDTINIHNIVFGVIYNAKVTLDTFFMCDIEVPEIEESVYSNGFATVYQKLESKIATVRRSVSNHSNILNRTFDGNAQLVDLEEDGTVVVNGETKTKYKIGSGVPDTLVISENPATGNTNWNTGRVIKFNYNGFGVSTSGIDGPYEDFAVYYDETRERYIIQGIEAILEIGQIAGWDIGSWERSNIIHNGIKKTFSYTAYINENETETRQITFVLDSYNDGATMPQLIQIYESDENGNPTSGSYIFNLGADGTVHGNAFNVGSSTFLDDSGLMCDNVVANNVSATTIKQDDDTSWKTFDYKTYSNGTGAATNYKDYHVFPLRYRKKLGFVELRGAFTLKENKSVTSSATLQSVGTLPDGYRPSFRISQVCQGSGKNIFLLIIDSDGTVSMSRYRNESGYATYSTGTTTDSEVWLSVQLVFMPN